MYHIGQKLICIDNTPDTPLPWLHSVPQIGATYTVAENNRKIYYTRELCVALVELPGWIYREGRFRPAESEGFKMLKQLEMQSC